jgi:hypothetical protein
MSIIPFSNLLVGIFSGITAFKNNTHNIQNKSQLFYKQEHLDYKMLGAYYSIITPFQVIGVYSNLDILSKIRLQGIKPYFHIPATISLVTIGNGAVFGVGYIFGQLAYSALH